MRCLLPALALLATGPAAAGPLNPDWIAAEARWLVHLDVEALKGSTIGQVLLDEQDNRLNIDWSDLDEFAREVGMDPRTDLMSFTVYGTSEDLEDDTVVIAVTNARADNALENAMASPDIRVREIELDGYTLYKLSSGDDRLYVHLRRYKRQQRLVVIANLRHELVDALEVIDGRGLSLSPGKGSIMASRPRPDSIVFIAAGNMSDFADIEPASEILRLSKGVAIDVGETGGQVHAEAAVAAEDAEVAESIAAVIDGMIALGHLIGSQDPELRPLRRFVKAFDVTSRDNEVTVRFRFDAAELLDGLEQVTDP